MHSSAVSPLSIPPSVTIPGTSCTSSKTAVLYLGQVATYICAEGEIQPAYPVECALTAEILPALVAILPSATTVGSSLAAQQFTNLSNDSEVMHSNTRGSLTAHEVEVVVDNSSTSRTAGIQNAKNKRHSHLHQCVARLRSCLAGHHVVAIVPICAAPAYLEQLTPLLLSPAGAAAGSLTVVSDVLADTVACGVEDGVVLHGSLTHITMGHVKDGATIRYASSKIGGICAIAGKEFAEQSASPTSLSKQLTGIDLSEPRYRAELIAAFGYSVYNEVMDAHARRRQEQPCEGSGKGKGRQRVAAGSGKEDAEWKQQYTRRQRSSPGVVEKLLARVVKGGVSAVTGQLPAIVAGEALQVPLYGELLTYVVRRCGEATLAAAEADARAKQREADKKAVAAAAALEAESTARATGGEHDKDSKNTHHQPVDSKMTISDEKVEEKKGGKRQHEALLGSGDERGGRAKLVRKERRFSSSTASSSPSTSDGGSEKDEEDSNEEDEDENEDKESSGCGSGSSTESTKEEDEEDTDDTDSTSSEGDWLYLQELPLPDVPWWLPLLGGSVVSEFAHSDMRGMRITLAEATSTKGAIVFWKAML